MVGRRTSIFFMCAGFSATGLAIAAAETSQEPPADPLAAAKRDYEALKNGGIQESQPGALKLRRPLPSLDAGGEALPMPSPIQRARRLESIRSQRSATRSANWLIDGVKHHSGTSTTGIDSPLRDEFGGEQEASELDDFFNDESIAVGLRQRESGRAREVDAARKASADRSIQTYNPLDSYMSKWMTPGDFELLRTNSDRSLPAGNTPPSRAVPPLPSAPSSPVASLPSRFEAGLDGRSPLLDGIADNPYIGEPAMPSVPLSNISAPTFPEPVSSSLTPLLPALSPTADRAAPPPAKPSLAEALRTDDDAKFFKQLKRF